MRAQNRQNWNAYVELLDNTDILECEPASAKPTAEEIEQLLKDDSQRTDQDRQRDKEDDERTMAETRQRAVELSKLPDLSRGPNNRVIAALLGSIYAEPSTSQSSPPTASSRSIETLEALHDIVQTHPQNRLASMHLLKACELSRDHRACGEQMIDKAKILNADNSVFWSTLARLHIVEGNVDEATTALEQAIEAPQYEDFLGQQMELFHNATMLLDNNSSKQQYLEAMNYALSVDLDTGKSSIPLFDFCTVHALARADIAAACLNYGARMEKDGSTLIAHFLGIGLQIEVSKSLGNTQMQEALEERDSNFRRKMLNDDYTKASSLMEHDELLNLDYFQTWFGYGELEARNYLVMEARRLSADSTYNPCGDSTISTL